MQDWILNPVLQALVVVPAGQLEANGLASQWPILYKVNHINLLPTTALLTTP